jgi:hypothetical protein
VPPPRTIGEKHIPALKTLALRVVTLPPEVDSLSGTIGSILLQEDRVQVLRMIRPQTPKPVHRHMNTLLLLDDGWAAERAYTPHAMAKLLSGRALPN